MRELVLWQPALAEASAGSSRPGFIVRSVVSRTFRRGATYGSSGDDIGEDNAAGDSLDLGDFALHETENVLL